MYDYTVSKLEKLQSVARILEYYINNNDKNHQISSDELKAAYSFILDMCDSYTQDFK
jgi:hypothetical protein